MEARSTASGSSALIFRMDARWWPSRIPAILRSTFAVIFNCQILSAISNWTVWRSGPYWFSPLHHISRPDIPEKAREAPTYGPAQAIRQQPSLSVLASTKVYTTSLPTAPTSAPSSRSTQPPSFVQTYTKPEVVPPSRHLLPPARQLIEPPSRHLTPPLPSSGVAAQKKSISVSPVQVQQPSSRQRRPLEEIIPIRQPAQFGLGMKSKMRFSRSLADVTSILDTMLPHSIQEEFPLNFDHEIVARLVEKQVRSRRSINSLAGDNHHHHHHHDHHEEDRGCTILGIHYQLGEVIGEFAVCIAGSSETKWKWVMLNRR